MKERVNEGILGIVSCAVSTFDLIYFPFLPRGHGRSDKARGSNDIFPQEQEQLIAGLLEPLPSQASILASTSMGVGWKVLT